MSNLEYKTRIIEKAIEKSLDTECTKEFIKLLESTDYSRIMEIHIGIFAEATG